MRKHILPLTYQPKIPAVLDGTCTQTIRAGRKFQVGDLVMFHGWEGKPYRSKWSFRTPYWKTTYVKDIRVLHTGIIALLWKDEDPWFGWRKSQIGKASLFTWDTLDGLAELDRIRPRTGEALRDVLFSMHKIPDDGLLAQITRWDPTAEVP